MSDDESDDYESDGEMPEGIERFRHDYNPFAATTVRVRRQTSLINGEIEYPLEEYKVVGDLVAFLKGQDNDWGPLDWKEDDNAVRVLWLNDYISVCPYRIIFPAGTRCIEIGDLDFRNNAPAEPGKIVLQTEDLYVIDEHPFERVVEAPELLQHSFEFTFWHMSFEEEHCRALMQFKGTIILCFGCSFENVTGIDFGVANDQGLLETIEFFAIPTGIEGFIVFAKAVGVQQMKIRTVLCADKGFNLLCRSLRGLDTVEKLTFHVWEWDTRRVRSLAKALRSNRGITHVNFYFDEEEEEGEGDWLHGNKWWLHELDCILDENRARKGALALAEIASLAKKQGNHANAQYCDKVFCQAVVALKDKPWALRHVLAHNEETLVSSLQTYLQVQHLRHRVQQMKSYISNCVVEQVGREREAHLQTLQELLATAESLGAHDVESELRSLSQWLNRHPSFLA